MKKISVIITIIFLTLFTIGCNTIAGTVAAAKSIDSSYAAAYWPWCQMSREQRRKYFVN